MEPDEALGAVADLNVDPVEARWLRAIGECMSILRVNDEVAKVVSESGRRYLVNSVEGWCDCPDHERRGADAIAIDLSQDGTVPVSRDRDS